MWASTDTITKQISFTIIFDSKTWWRNWWFRVILITNLNEWMLKASNSKNNGQKMNHQIRILGSIKLKLPHPQKINSKNVHFSHRKNQWCKNVFPYVDLSNIHKNNIRIYVRNQPINIGHVRNMWPAMKNKNRSKLCTHPFF